MGWRNRLLAVLVLALVACVVSSSTPVAAISSGYTGDGNNLNLSLLRVGDVIAVSGVVMGGLLDVFVPGHFTHVAMYIGNGQMIEAWKDGVRVISVTEVLKANDAAIVRVRTTDSIRQAAVNWALTKVGYPYDYIWLTYVGGKQVYGNSYYCSELVWAAYLAVGGPDVDQNPGWSWTYGNNVAPQEIVDDGDTYIVAYSA